MLFRSLTLARQQSGLWWHAYKSVLSRVEKEDRVAKRFGRALHPKSSASPMHFSLYFPNGIAIEDVLAGKSRLLRFNELIQTPNETGKAELLFATKAISRRELKHVRVPVQWHRPLPKNCRILRVDLVEHLCLRKPTWELNFTLEEPSAPSEARKVATEETICGIDFGWRVHDGQLRVAYWVSSNGDTGQIMLPEDWLRQAKYLNQLRKTIRDNSLPYADALAELKVFPEEKRAHPTRGLINLYSRRGTLPKEAELLLGSWWKENARALREAEGLGARLERRRTDLYRRAAADLVARYDRLATEELKLIHLKNLQETSVPYVTRQNFEWAKINELKHWIAHACKKANKAFQAVPCKNITQMCSACGHINRQNTKQKVLTCERCQRPWDQDENACNNTIDLAQKAVVAR